jgi:hypothetical protein
MIAEPYINRRNGNIDWFSELSGVVYGFVASPTIPIATVNRIDNTGEWQPYADFEREKLRELGTNRMYTIDDGTYGITTRRRRYSLWSDDLIGYNSYHSDSESSRLLKRAEFLKAVCEKEGVEWLPEENPPGIEAEFTFKTTPAFDRLKEELQEARDEKVADCIAEVIKNLKRSGASLDGVTIVIDGDTMLIQTKPDPQ